MSKKILVLTGSPRQGGNSDLMADAFIKGAQAATNHTADQNSKRIYNSTYHNETSFIAK